MGIFPWILLSIVCFLYLISWKWKKYSLSLYYGDKAYERTYSRIKKIRKGIKAFLLITALFLLASSLNLNYFAGEESDKLQINSKEKIAFLLDVSLSMLSKDAKPSRLERAKNYIVEIMKNESNSSFALILFAGSSFLQCPYTSDHEIIEEFLDIIDINTIKNQGTSLTKALLTAKMLHEKSQKKQGVEEHWVILTDGADYSKEDIKTYEAISELPLKISIIGVGGSKPVPIELIPKRVGAEPLLKKDRKYKTVYTKLDTKNLNKIAGSLNASFFPLPSQAPRFSKAPKRIFLNKPGRKNTNIDFIVFVVLPLILLLIEVIITQRSRKKLKWAGRFEQ